MKEWATLITAYLVAWPCYYAGYLYESALRAFANGRRALRDDAGIK